DLAEESTASTVLHILQLNREAVRIGEVELRCPALGAAAIRHPERNVGHERSAALSVLPGQAVIDKQLRNLGRIEIGHRHAGVIDAGATLAGASSWTTRAARGRRTSRNRRRCTRRWSTCARR